MTLFLTPLMFVAGATCALLSIAFWLRNLFDYDDERRRDAIGLGIAGFVLILIGGFAITFTGSSRSAAMGIGATCVLIAVGGFFAGLYLLVFSPLRTGLAIHARSLFRTACALLLLGLAIVAIAQSSIAH